MRNYHRYMNLYILPALGRMRLQAITPSHIRQLYLRMQSEGKGARTIQLVHVTLHCAFAQAVKEGLIGHNPLDAVERPKVETKRYDILTEKQARTFITAAKGHPYEALFFLALTTGMRKGEILGLMWTDVDREKSTLRVERQLQPVSYEGGVLKAGFDIQGHAQGADHFQIMLKRRTAVHQHVLAPLKLAIIFWA